MLFSRADSFSSPKPWLTASLLAVAFTFVLSGRVLAGGGPENVFLVINSESAESMTVANHYIALREIPPNNVFYISWKPIVRSTRAAKFRDKLLKPILEEIDRRQLSGQIDQIVYSTDFPFSIDYRNEFADQGLPSDRRRMVSLTGATYLYQFSLNDRKELVGLNNNFYANVPKDRISHSQAFSGRQLWQPGGKPSEKEGVRYLLSTSLGVTYGDGNTVEEIVEYLRRARSADATRPEGTIYYMSNKDIRTRVRAGTYAAAVAELQALGVNAVVANGTVPTGQRDVTGLTTGTRRPDLRIGNVKLLPGALVDNLTSFGGAFHMSREKRGQILLSHYLRMGAAGASGTVIEPTANPYKFPQATLHVHYARGCSMAESFYQAVQGPYQLLIAGDPLCQPWAVQAEIGAGEEGSLGSGAVSGEIRLKPSYEFAAEDATRRIDHFEMFVDGVRTQVCAPQQELLWDTTQLADGFHRLVIVGFEDSAIKTQSRFAADVILQNQRGGVSLQVDGGPQFSAGHSVVVRVTASQVADVVLTHNGREIGKVTDGSGEITVDSNQLGSGPIELEAHSEGEPAFQARPLRFEFR